MRELPTFRGYTIDLRLGQFRRACPNCFNLEFISFESEEGDELLLQLLAFYKAGGKVYFVEYSDKLKRVIPVDEDDIHDAVLKHC